MLHVARLYIGVLAAYAAVAIAYSWPLPLHFDTHLTGDTAGDTGVYVWNQWVFRHELLQLNRLPYFTDRIFSTSGWDANLSLHNYTPFQNLLAVPLAGAIGTVAAFNTVMLVMRVLTAFATFLLARRLTGRTMESWLAGALFAWSPVLVTRSMGHFSLVAAAPLAIFLLLLLPGTGASQWGWRRGVALGLTIAWATSADAYYGVYCVMLGALFLLSRAVRVTPVALFSNVIGGRIVDVGIILLTGVIVWLTLGWRTRLAVFGQIVSVTSLYTPVLVLTVLVMARVGWRYGLRFEPITGPLALSAIRTTAWAGLSASLALAPLLYAVARRIMTSGFDAAPIYWRSSPAGVDALALFIPNPNHPFAPESWRQWLASPRPDAYLENVASIPLVALGVFAFAWFRGWRPSRWWALVAGAFGVLALGPFIHLAGMNTHVPGPWALLRYVPVLGLTRTPTRFSVVMMLALAVLFASAMAWIVSRFPHRRRAILAATTVVIGAELLPAPLEIYSAAVPSVYEHVTSAPPDTRVLHLPFGVRDGTVSEGDFSAQTLYFQTQHGRRLIGGYLSRVSSTRRSTIRSEAVLDTFMRISEARSATVEEESLLQREGPAFLRRAHVDFVVMDRRRFSDELRTRTVLALRLRFVKADGYFELYRPIDEP